jgi:hypothetical protein
MAAHTRTCGCTAGAEIRPIDDRTQERRDADRRGVPNSDGYVRPFVLLQELLTWRRFYSVQVDASARLDARAGAAPESRRMSFRDLADRVAQRLQHVVAGCDSRGAHVERSASSGKREREVRMDQLVWNPARLVGNQVPSLDPGNLLMRMVEGAGV